ncbi:hypothetical protein [Bacillus alkalisoli]|uniref:hypothetical protein n=1 Tax=Bacillus alkalisoli TaxID=2011008 RepID=UPI003872D1E8
MMAHEIMDEMNFNNNTIETDALKVVVDNLSRAIGDLADPSGHYSLEYIEEKVGKAHSLLAIKKRGVRI